MQVRANLYKYSMEYLKIYNSIIKHRIENPLNGLIYSEKHHIIPRSFGGSNSPTNIVVLTAREHYICHLLLLKIQPVGSVNFYKMLKAFMMMCWCQSKNQTRYTTSRQFEKYRIEFSRIQSKNQSGNNNSQFGTKWVSNPVTGENKKTIGDVPDGWVLGRHKHYVDCKICKNIFLPRGRNTVLCSKECFRLSRKNQFTNTSKILPL